MVKTGDDGSVVSWPPLIALLVGGLVLWSASGELDSVRPAAGALEPGSLTTPYAVPARLWEDPLHAIEKSWLPTTGDSKEPLKSLEGSLVDVHGLLGSTPCDKVLLMPVFLDAGLYPELGERRLRDRYAVLSALGVGGYQARETSTLRYFSVRLSRISNGIKRTTVRIPYEWFVPQVGTEGNEGAHPSSFEGILVLWLPEQEFGEEPLRGLCETIQVLSRKVSFSDTSSPPYSFRSPWKVCVIGPSGSSILAPFMAEAQLDYPPGSLSEFQVFSDRATISNGILYDLYAQLLKKKGESAGPLFKPNRKVFSFPTHLSLYRTITTDEALARALLAELELRRAAPLQAEQPEQSQHVVIVSEWDTLYSRSFKHTLTAAVGDLHGEQLSFFTYLRGVDGRTIDEERQDDDRNEGALENTSKISKNSYVQPDGTHQLDYIRRLQVLLHRMDLELRSERRGRIAAIGVLGSDLYDKMLLLRALRSSFRDAVFFTTDLDARYLHPAERKWARNLVVAAPFGFSPDESMESRLPPFRDSYQTSTFQACLRALEYPVQQQRGLGPRVFEIGRDHAYDLHSPLQERTIHAGFIIALMIGGLLVLTLRPWLTAVLQIRKFSMRVVLGDPILLGFCAIILGSYLFLAKLISSEAASPGGEPYSFLGGVSIWPTQLIRLAAIWISLYFPFLAFRSLADQNLKIQREFFGIRESQRGRAARSWAEIYRWARENAKALGMCAGVGLLGVLIGLVIFLKSGKVPPSIGVPVLLWTIAWAIRKRKALDNANQGIGLAFEVVVASLGCALVGALLCANYPGFKSIYLGVPLLLFVIYLFTGFLRGYRVSIGISHWMPSRNVECVFATSIFEDYARRGDWRNSIARALPYALTYAIFLWSIFDLGGRPGIPFRGETSLAVDRSVLILSVTCFIFVLFLVIDQTRLCKQWIDIHAKKRFIWPPSTIRAVRGDHPATWSASELYNIRLIAARTRVVDRLMYTPFVVLFLLLVARNNLFDAWHWNLPLFATFVMSAAGTVCCALLLRQSAERARTAALNEMEEELLRKRAGDPWECDQIEGMMAAVRKTREGAFCPIYEHPVVHAILIPVSGIGLIELLNIWLFL